MITVDEALRAVLQHATALPDVDVALELALGQVLARDIRSDVDSPPHDKALVDGFALLADDVSSGPRQLRVIEAVMAGGIPRKKVGSGDATQVMTGAPIPDGANAVVMVEHTESLGDGLVRVGDKALPVSAGQNIMPQATSIRKGDVVLRGGTPVRAIEIGLLAETGQALVPVIRQPQLAILATGNELVPVSERPSAGQLRNSNGPMLAAAAKRAGAVPFDLGIAVDDVHALEAAILKGLDADILVLSGGVSAGVLDLVPRVLKKVGIEQVFHKVQLKPGKPLWFGVTRAANVPKLVFGLPGNPVSSLVCFELFVQPAIAKLAGRVPSERSAVTARLAVAHTHRGQRPTYQPSRLINEPDGWVVRPLAWHGSADLSSLSSANALIHFPAGDRTYEAGEEVRVRLLPES